MIFVDMDGVLCDFDKLHARELSEKNPFPQSRVGFFLDLEPIDDAIDSVKFLQTKHEVAILTRPSIKNPHCWSEKAQWIEKYFGREMLNNMVITPRKDLLNDGKAYLIDDMGGSGQEAFGNRWIRFNKNKPYQWSKICWLFGLK